ncbi:hypothetical protein SAMCCGM7_pC0237 (plasmid) [Sinorhizobium americanum CCGM7]|nr:hypothetical protein SAMCCGM7_pC0237 [Sinorhizobium americanum CCGM7]
MTCGTSANVLAPPKRAAFTARGYGKYGQWADATAISAR